MSFYKYSTVRAIAEWDNIVFQGQELKREAINFCARFGGKPVYHSSASSNTYLYGIVFDDHPYVCEELWTKPELKCKGARWPRKKVPASLQEQSAALHKLWKGQFPDRRVTHDRLYASLGLDWGMLLFTGFTMFRQENTIFLKVDATPSVAAEPEEILGSEFEQALKTAKTKCEI
jgi:hypothetical protein